MSGGRCATSVVFLAQRNSLSAPSLGSRSRSKTGTLLDYQMTASLSTMELSSGKVCTKYRKIINV